MSQPRHGATEKIAGDDPCAVYRCPCGCLHVHIGAFTVRLDGETFRQLASVLSQAALALTSPPTAQSH